MAGVPGISDPEEVHRNRKKYIAIRRASRRLDVRLADIDWEYDSLKPGLREFEQQTTIVGELPEFVISDERPAAKEGRTKKRSK